MSCGVLPPGGRSPFHDKRGRIRGCPHPIGHHGPHRCYVPGDDPLRIGALFDWDSEDDCGCCDIRDPDRCFWYSEVEP